MNYLTPLGQETIFQALVDVNMADIYGYDLPMQLAEQLYCDVVSKDNIQALIYYGIAKSHFHSNIITQDQINSVKDIDIDKYVQAIIDVSVVEELEYDEYED